MVELLLKRNKPVAIVTITAIVARPNLKRGINKLYVCVALSEIFSNIP